MDSGFADDQSSPEFELLFRPSRQSFLRKRESVEERINVENFERDEDFTRKKQSTVEVLDGEVLHSGAVFD